MKISGRSDRLSHSNMYLIDGDFKYEVQTDYYKWPEELILADKLCPVFDKNNHLFVCTSNLDYPIVEFDEKGNYLRAFGHGLFDRPHSLCITKENTLLVSDTEYNLHTVQEITFDGKLVRTFGKKGVPSDSGYDPLAWKKNKEAGMYTEKELNEFYKNNTAYYVEMNTIKRAAEPFNRPCFMAQTLTGEYVAADGYGNCAVHFFDKDGKLFKTLGGFGTGEGEYRLPHWVTVDKYNRVWVCDRENSRAYCYNTKGEVLNMLEGGQLWRVASSACDDKYLYFGELGGGLTIVDIDKLEVVAQFGYKGINMFAFHGITVDKDSNIIISNISQNRPIGNLIRLKKL